MPTGWVVTVTSNLDDLPNKPILNPHWSGIALRTLYAGSGVLAAFWPFHKYMQLIFVKKTAHKWIKNKLIINGRQTVEAYPGLTPAPSSALSNPRKHSACVFAWSHPVSVRWTVFPGCACPFTSPLLFRVPAESFLYWSVFVHDLPFETDDVDWIICAMLFAVTSSWLPRLLKCLSKRCIEVK